MAAKRSKRKQPAFSWLNAERQRTLIRLALAFAGSGMVMAYAYTLNLTFWQKMLAQQVAWALSLVGVKALAVGTLVSTSGLAVQVVPACVGVPAFVAFAALVIASKMQLRYLVFTPLIWLLNIGRLTTSIASGSFELVHTAWRVVGLVLVFLLWYWLYTARPLRRQSRRKR